MTLIVTKISVLVSKNYQNFQINKVYMQQCQRGYYNVCILKVGMVVVIIEPLLICWLIETLQCLPDAMYIAN